MLPGTLVTQEEADLSLEVRSSAERDPSRRLPISRLQLFVENLSGVTFEALSS